MGDASRRARAAHESEIDAGLARLQAHGGRGERLLAEWARRARLRLGRTRRGLLRLRRRGGGSAAARGAARLGFDARRRRLRLLRPRFRRGGKKRIRQARRVDANELGADSQHVPDRAAEREHAARHGRWNLDRRLVGHDGGDDLILPDEIADLDRPLDDLGFRHALADVGHLDRAHAHLEASMAFTSARPTRAGPGK